MRYFIRIFIHIHMDIEIFHIEWKQLNFLICIKNQHGRQNDLFINFLINFFFLGGGCNELWVKFNQPALQPLSITSYFHQSVVAINFNNKVVALGTGFGVIHWFTLVCVHTWSRQDTETHFYNKHTSVTGSGLANLSSLASLQAFSSWSSFL